MYTYENFLSKMGKIGLYIEHNNNDKSTYTQMYICKCIWKFLRYEV